MQFNSYEFALFLTVVLPVYYLSPHRFQNRFLILASYTFYGWWDWRFCGLVFVSTLVDYRVGVSLGRTEHELRRRRLLWVSILTNLGLLGTFKYFDFFSESTARLLEAVGMSPDPITLRVILPVGISFYTFQTLSYTIDVYRRTVAPTRDFESFALYVCYFPQLVAGPIERASRLLPQIRSPRTVTSEAFRGGVLLILTGYFKKVALADAVAPLVDQAFSRASVESSGTLVLAVYLFAIQIYGDFSGYSDIARGTSRILGIELMENFRQPYLSANITEFWRRWHISLSQWLRDYLYISLGGSRGTRWQTYRNLMTTMLLGGLWHGAGWGFVLWGGLHGLFLSIHKLLLRGARPATEMPHRGAWVRYLFSVVGTFHLVCLAWVFFRADDMAAAWHYLGAIFFNGGAPLTGYVVVVLVYGTALVLLDAPCWRRGSELPFSGKAPSLLRAAAYAVMVSMCFWVGSQQASPFIYFQF